MLSTFHLLNRLHIKHIKALVNIMEVNSIRNRTEITFSCQPAKAVDNKF